MNDRQRDLFLWKWSHRRQTGRAKVGIRGAVIGAMGGLLFAMILASQMGSDGPHDVQWLLEYIRRFGMLCVLSIPTFAAMGFLGAMRVFNSHERMYQRMLHDGVVVPMQPPALPVSDRGPAIAVAVTVLILVSLIVAAIVYLG